MKTKTSYLACLAACLAALPATHAAVTSGGNFQTGTPTPTLSLTAPITLSITTSGSLQTLVFDEWVTSDGSSNNAIPSPANETLSYQIDNGTVLTIGIHDLTDNLVGNAGSITANDGYLFFNSGIAVTKGQTITFLPGSLTFASGGANFNPPPASFTGNVFATRDSGILLSNSTNAPEPSTWALLSVGSAGVLGFALRQRRCRAV